MCLVYKGKTLVSLQVIWDLFKSLSIRAKYSVYITRIKANLHEDLRIFMIMPL
jgi:hypothetical protein